MDSNPESIEEDTAAAQVDDVDLLTFQKQRSTPRVSLSQIGLDDLGGVEEKVVLDIDNFGQMSKDNKDYFGMASAGTEEKIVRDLHKAGSFDPEQIKASPLLRASGPMGEESDSSDGKEKEETKEEEKKEEEKQE